MVIFIIYIKWLAKRYAIRRLLSYLPLSTELKIQPQKFELFDCLVPTNYWLIVQLLSLIILCQNLFSCLETYPSILTTKIAQQPPHWIDSKAHREMAKIQSSLLENERIPTEIFDWKCSPKFPKASVEKLKKNVKYFLLIFRPYSDNVSRKAFAQKTRKYFGNRFGRC